MNRPTDDKGQAVNADSTRNSELNGALGAELTKEQFDDLPSGACVTVTWSGGNGPHNYTVTKTEDDKSAIYGKYDYLIGTPDCIFDKVWLASNVY